MDTIKLTYLQWVNINNPDNAMLKIHVANSYKLKESLSNLALLRNKIAEVRYGNLFKN